MIGALIDSAAARRGGACYLKDAGGSATLSYAGLRRATAAWGRYLDDAGVPVGGRVAVRLPSPVAYATALVGIVGAGRVAVPLDPAAPAAEAARVLAAAAPVYELPPGGGPPPGCTAPDFTAPDFTPPDFTDPYYTVLSCAGSAGGIFLCTSGTTGTPKGILLREDQLGHVAGCVAGHHRLTPADRGYCCLPLFHVNAEVVGLLATLTAGGCLVLDRKFSRRVFWDTIERHEITWINAVPAIISVLANQAANPRARPPGRVRFVRSASAPLPPSALRRFEEAFGIPVVETYGMTEAASMITANPLDGPRKPGSVGVPAGAEVRVLRAAGEHCEAFEVGRVHIRGRGVISEYATGGSAGAIGPDGWLDTGDLGHLDPDGYLFLAGRSDDVINRGGEKIYPREIEDFLLAQPCVRSAAVVAARDEVLGERPVAYVVPAWPEHPIEDALREACETALPKPKRPTAFHVVPELPVGPTGKVMRARLRDSELVHSPLSARVRRPARRPGDANGLASARKPAHSPSRAVSSAGTAAASPNHRTRWDRGRGHRRC